MWGAQIRLSTGTRRVRVGLHEHACQWQARNNWQFRASFVIIFLETHLRLASELQHSARLLARKQSPIPSYYLCLLFSWIYWPWDKNRKSCYWWLQEIIKMKPMMGAESDGGQGSLTLWAAVTGFLLNYPTINLNWTSWLSKIIA